MLSEGQAELSTKQRPAVKPTSGVVQLPSPVQTRNCLLKAIRNCLEEEKKASRSHTWKTAGFESAFSGEAERRFQPRAASGSYSRFVLLMYS